MPVSNVTKLHFPARISWTPQESGVLTPLRSVWYDTTSGLWTVCGDNGVVLTSTDGITWTQRSSGTIRPLRTVKKFQGTWYIIGWGDGTASLQILESSDSITWSDIGESSNATSFVSMDFNDSVLVCVGWEDNPAVIGKYVVFNGSTWTVTTNANHSYYYGIKWNGTDNLWGIVGNAADDEGVSAVPYMATSSDLTTWTTRTTGIGGALYEENEIWIIDYADGVWKVASGRADIRTSTDAITWTDVTTTVMEQDSNNSWRFTHNDVATLFCGGNFVDTGRILISTDNGATWTLSYEESGLPMMFKAWYGPGYWVAVGSNGRILRSS